MRTLRNIFRRKLRVVLTIVGITIGVLALVVMGSMAEKINLLVAGGTEYFKDKVIVQQEGSSMFMSTAFQYTKGEDLRAVPGVAAVTASVDMLLDGEQGAEYDLSIMRGSDRLDESAAVGDEQVDGADAPEATLLLHRVAQGRQPPAGVEDEQALGDAVAAALADEGFRRRLVACPGEGRVDGEEATVGVLEPDQERKIIEYRALVAVAFQQFFLSGMQFADIPRYAEQGRLAIPTAVNDPGVDHDFATVGAQQR